MPEWKAMGAADRLTCHHFTFFHAQLAGHVLQPSQAAACTDFCAIGLGTRARGVAAAFDRTRANLSVCGPIEHSRIKYSCTATGDWPPPCVWFGLVPWQ
jgi:hypothetical protein